MAQKSNFIKFLSRFPVYRSVTYHTTCSTASILSDFKISITAVRLTLEGMTQNVLKNSSFGDSRIAV